MKTILSVILLLIVQYSSFGQNGFTNKAEAKNEMKSRVKEGKWIEYLKINNDASIGTTTSDSAQFYRLIVYKDGKFTETERLYDTLDKLVDSTYYTYGNAEKKCITKTEN